jgi:hypothetical protein
MVGSIQGQADKGVFGEDVTVHAIIVYPAGRTPSNEACTIRFLPESGAYVCTSTCGTPCSTVIPGGLAVGHHVLQLDSDSASNGSGTVDVDRAQPGLELRPILVNEAGTFWAVALLTNGLGVGIDQRQTFVVNGAPVPAAQVRTSMWPGVEVPVTFDKTTFKATVTATFAGDANYKPASASATYDFGNRFATQLVLDGGANIFNPGPMTFTVRAHLRVQSSPGVALAGIPGAKVRIYRCNNTLGQKCNDMLGWGTTNAAGDVDVALSRFFVDLGDNAFLAVYDGSPTQWPAIAAAGFQVVQPN